MAYFMVKTVVYMRRSIFCMVWSRLEVTRASHPWGR